jgi:hypothetical protein
MMKQPKENWIYFFMIIGGVQLLPCWDYYFIIDFKAEAGM